MANYLYRRILVETKTISREKKYIGRKKMCVIENNIKTFIYETIRK